MRKILLQNDVCAIKAEKVALCCAAEGRDTCLKPNITRNLWLSDIGFRSTRS